MAEMAPNGEMEEGEKGTGTRRKEECSISPSKASTGQAWADSVGRDAWEM